jgi:hypothetical protein
VAVTLSCGHSHPTEVASASRELDGDAVPSDRYPDDVARFLAGLPSKPGSPFAETEKDSAWVEHRRQFDAAWNRKEHDDLPGMRAFRKTELSDAAIAHSRIFYPFSGPDALVVTEFFPGSPSYVLVGLEPAGTLPPAERIKQKDLAGFLSTVRESVSSELGRSFFVTREMDRQFRGQVTDGLFLPILQLLVRTGHTILGYRYVRLDEAGSVIARPLDYHAPGKIGNKGVELQFRTDADNSLHRLLYLSVNLSDERLAQDPQFLKFLGTLRGVTTYLKATSYMLHRAEFSTIREQLLAVSGAVLQDDSGIPYRFFGAPWKTRLFGDFDRPFGSFKWYQQPDLKKMYQSSAPKPLSFRIGYGYGRVPSNLQFFTR